MAELLRGWLHSDLALKSIDSNATLEEAFASGYGFGELLNKFNLQPDLGDFLNESSQDAKIRNYSLVQPVLHSMGIKLNPTTLEQLMAAKEGVAPRIIYEIKVILDELENSLLTIQRTASPLAQTFAIDPPRNSDRVQSWPFRTVPRAFERSMGKSVEYNIHRVLENPKQTRAEKHVERFEEKRLQQEKMAQREAEKAEAKEEDMRQKRIRHLRDSLYAKIRKSLEKRQQERKVLEETWRRREEWEKEETRLKTLPQERADRRKKAKNLADEKDVINGIEEFEQCRQRRPEGEEAAPESGMGAEADADADKAATEALEGLPPDFMDKLKERKAEEDQARKDREMKRRMAIQQQKEVAAEQDAKQREQALLKALNYQSIQEIELAEKLSKARMEKEVVKNNRLARERELAEIRELENKQKQLEEMQAIQAMREQYQSMAAEQQQQRRKVIERWAAEEHKETESLSRRVIAQIITIAEAEIDFKERTERTFPEEERRQWSALFLKDLIPEACVPLIIDSQFDETLNKAAMEDYLHLRGEWSSFDLDVCGSRILGEIICNAKTVADRPELEKVPSILDLPFRICVTGMPFSGKTAVSKKIAQSLGFKVFTVDEIVKSAIDAAPEPTTEAAPEEPGSGPDGDGGENKKEDNNKPPGEAAADSWAKADEETLDARISHIGAVAKAALEKGDRIPDDVVVNLIVLNIAMFQLSMSRPNSSGEQETEKSGRKGKKSSSKTPKTEEPVTNGFILDGYPCSRQQSSLLSQAFSGVDTQYEENESMVDSPLAPYPKDRVAEITCPAAFDIVISLSVPDDASAIRRAMGRRRDPKTGNIYHIEFDPPAATQPDEKKKKDGGEPKLADLEEMQPADESECITRLDNAKETLEMMEQYWDYFKILHRIDTSATVEQVEETVRVEIEGAQRAKHAMQQAVSAAKAAESAANAATEAAAATHEAAANVRRAAIDLFTAKKAELEALLLIKGGSSGDEIGEDGPRAAEQAVKLEHSRYAAETLQAAEAAEVKAAEAAANAASARDQAAEQHSKAEECVQNAAATPEALALAEQAAAEAMSLAEQAKEAAAAAQSALVSSRDVLAKAQNIQESEDKEEVDEALNQAQEAEDDLAINDSESSKGIPEHQALDRAQGHQIWASYQQLQSTYESGLQTVMHSLRHEKNRFNTHLVDLKTKFSKFLVRSDNKQEMVDSFQNQFNQVDADERSSEETKAEWNLTVDELRDQLWDLCDARFEEAKENLQEIRADSFIVDHINTIQTLGGLFSQLEMDRLWNSVAIVRSYHLYKSQVDAALYPMGESPRLIESVDECQAKPSASAWSSTDDQSPPQPKTTAVNQTAAEGDESDSGLDWLAAAKDKLPILYGLQSGILQLISDNSLWVYGNNKNGDGSGEGDGDGDGGDKDDLQALKANIEFQSAVEDLKEAAVTRLRLIAEYVQLFSKSMEDVTQSTYQRIEGWMAASLEAECSSVSAFTKAVKDAIVRSVPLPYAIKLGCSTFEIDCSVMRMEPVCLPPKAAPLIEPATEGRLPVALILDLARGYRTIAPSRRLSILQAAELLCQVKGSESCPTIVLDASYTKLVDFASKFDFEGKGIIDWRHLIASLLLESLSGTSYPSAAALSQSYQKILAQNADGFVSLRELDDVDFMSGLQADEQRLDGESGTGPRYDKACLQKRVLYEAFSVSKDGVEVLDAPAALLFLCADNSAEEGLTKAAQMLMSEQQPSIPQAVFRKILDLDALVDSSASSAASGGEHPQLMELAGRDTVSMEEALELARQDALVGSHLGRYHCVKLSSML